MKRTITVAAVAATLLTGAGTAHAVADLTPRSKPLTAAKQAAQLRTLTGQLASLQARIDALAATPAIPGPKGDKGDPGVNGSNGGSGPAGPAGPKGEPGTAGKDGVNGTNGRDGADGRGMPSGTLILVGGSCPSGMTLEGKEYGWRVYSGNPFTGVGSELWITACRVN